MYQLKSLWKKQVLLPREQREIGRVKRSKGEKNREGKQEEGERD